VAVNAILGCSNRLGIVNRFVLAQSFLKGSEFVVNTVSLNGKHHVSDIWQCHKHRVLGAGYVPGCEELLPFNGVIQQQLVAYVIDALDALGFTQGPAHFEIMMTERGPSIIEVGARIQGGVNPNVHIECMNSSQLLTSIDTRL
jgi:biotin carboxylase